jgi:hypothetical protein
MVEDKLIITNINWVVRGMNADCPTAVVYQTVYHRLGQNMYFYCSNYIGNQFIIAIRPLGGLWYMTNIPRLKDCIQALRVASCTRTTLSRGILAVYHTSSVLIG